MPRPHRGFFRLLCVTCLALLQLFPLRSRAGTASDIREFTGAPTRVVWIQDAGPEANVYSEHPTIRLMAFDTEDSKGERPLVPNIGWYGKPLLTADGQRVVFANIADHTVNVINFDGTGLRQVLKNDEAYKLDDKAWDSDSLWTDPKSGVTWVYVKMAEQRRGQPAAVMRRYQLDHPEVSELVWDKTPVYMFMVDGDGRMASGGLLDGGDTSQGVFTLPNGTFYQRANGCWPSMSPDASHRSWVFTGNHRSLHFYTPVDRNGNAAYSGVDFFAPGINLPNGNETYHPRWTNNVHFVTLDSPFTKWSWKSDAKIPPDISAKVEIYIGKFKDDFSGIERWVQVTHNNVGDYWPNVWIKPSPEDLAALAKGPAAPEEKPSAPPDNKGLIYVWQTGADANQLNDPATGTLRQCSGELKGNARYGRYSVMDLTDGAFVPDDKTAPALLAACKASNQFALETVVTPTGAAARGESIIMAFADDPANDNFLLSEKGDVLALHLKTDGTGFPGPPVPIGNLVRNQPNHLIVSYADGRLAFYLNGSPVALPGALRGGLSNWTAQALIFGDTAKGGQNWTGLMEGIGLFNREINAPEARQRFLQFQNRIRARKPAETVIADLKLIGRCPAADPKGIAPYRRCLSVQLYEVAKVISGKLTDPKISVAQWSVLDGQVVPAYEKLAAGQTYRLVLEKMDDHPEQESERQISGDFDAASTQLYYEVRTPDVTQAALTAAAAPPANEAGSGPVPESVTVTDPTVDDLTLKDTVGIKGQGAVTAATVVDRGFGYTQAPRVHFSGGGGQGASGESVMGVTSLDLTNVGSGYTSEPTVTVAPPDAAGGRQATVKARIDKAGGTISGLEISDPGTGYQRTPQITFSGGGGSGAEAEAALSLTGIVITHGGSGYTSPPTITLDGGDGQDATAQAALQLKTYRFESGKSATFTNVGTLEQDGATLVFDWAVTGNNAITSPGFDNQGTWTLHNRSRLYFTSSTGRRVNGSNNSNSGTLSVLDHSRFGFAQLQSSGEIDLGAGTVLGQGEYANQDNSLANTGKGVLKIIGSSPDQPAIFGYIGEDRTGRRVIENGTADGASQAQLIIGTGSDATAFTVIGDDVKINNYAGCSLALNSGATLFLDTSHNGSIGAQDRDARIMNAGDMLLAGHLRVQTNHVAVGGIENSGKLTIRGDQVVVERLPNSNGGDGFYMAEVNSAQVLNLPGGLLQGSGTLSYVNSTGTREGRYLKVINWGTIAPGETSDKGGWRPGQLVFHEVNFGFGSPKLTENNPRPKPQGGTLQIGITGAPTAPGNYASLTLLGDNDNGKFELIKDLGNILNIVTAAGFTPHGTYRIVTATSVVGTFDTLQYNGATQVPYTVNYLPNGIEVVFP